MIVALFLQADPGLVAWRRPDAHGLRCVSCHSPDGIELSAFSFSREDVVRRAVRHLSAEDAEAIAELLRRRVPKETPPMERPLQPGGAPLPGATAGERDLEFLRALPNFAPRLTKVHVVTEADALRVRDEVLRIDLTKLPVGIPFNRLSEDAYHGNEHRTVANWLPDVPVAGVSTSAADRYLLEPSDANLRTLDAEAKRKIATARSPGELLAIAKYRSLLILQHQLRTGRLTGTATPHTQGINQNPFWDVAEIGRFYEEEKDVKALGLPDEVSARKSGGPAFSEQLRALRLPWFWMGWMLDPALQTSGLSGESQRADYFVRYLWKDGPYPAHAAFMVTKKLIEQGYNPRLWNNARFPQRYEISLSGFIMGDELNHLKLEGEYGTRFRLLAANVLRTAMFLERRALREKPIAFHPEAQANQIRLALSYLRRVDPAHGDADLARDLLQRLKRARALR